MGTGGAGREGAHLRAGKGADVWYSEGAHAETARPSVQDPVQARSYPGAIWSWLGGTQPGATLSPQGL